nr:Holliday junction branch migration protein RuvA [uncultured Blautia sp.]
MISFIRGLIADTTETSVILDNHGIGYEIFMTGNSIEQASRVNGEIRIHTYFHVREDVMQLYGFLSKDDLEMFRLLLNVNGIGPKAALGVLAGLTADELRFAVLSDDIKTLSKAPGIGKKTAQKLILELKDKLKLEDAFEKKLAHEQEVSAGAGSGLHDGRQEAVEALVALGYSSTDAMRAVRKVTDVAPDDVEGLLKAALKQL